MVSKKPSVFYLVLAQNLKRAGAEGRRNSMFFRFHVKCNAAEIYCTQITRKRETNKIKAIVLGFGDTIKRKWR